MRPSIVAVALVGLAASVAATVSHAQSAPPDSIPTPPAASAASDSIPALPTASPSDTTRAIVPPDTVASWAAPARPLNHPAWALVLSGGAARGLAHIGVLRALEEEGIRPGLVCGTSMGALVGGLYASGHSSAEIRDIMLHTDWDEIFGKEREHFEWRDTVVPDPWLAFVGEGLRLHLPSGMVDDSYINFELVEYFLRAEAMAQGDFDRLPIPFRCVGADAETTNPVVFDRGSVARAVRTSISIPPMFPAVPTDSTLLVDGGLASNLPISTARTLAPGHILAVDVSLPQVNLSDRSSLVEVSFSIFDNLNKRSQRDTVSSRDRLLALKLPGFGPMDFTMVDSLIEVGYRESKALVHEFAQLVRDSSDTARPDSFKVVLPPPRPQVAWLDRHGKESARADVASQLFGEPPPGAFDPDSLRPALQDVYRGDVFISAWPSFTVAQDSTTIVMAVESRPTSELTLALGYDNDVKGRINGSLVLRPSHERLADKITLGGTFDPLRNNVFLAVEPHSLARGANGWFARGGWRQTDVRLFDAQRKIHESTVERAEGLVGGQRRLTSRYVLQAGAGYGFAGTDARDLSGLLGAVSVQSGSAFGEGLQASFLVGNESYATILARATADVRLGPVVVRTAVRAGSSSRLTPPDEVQSLGGPESFAGLRKREWLGRDRLAGEVRVLHQLTSNSRVFAYGQAGTITQSISRPDLDGEVHFAGGAGFEAQVPFGPLNLDWGIDDQGDFRLDFNFGQRF